MDIFSYNVYSILVNDFSGMSEDNWNVAILIDEYLVKYNIVMKPCRFMTICNQLLQ